VGKFKNPGVCWEQQPQPVLDHDFPSDAVGRAFPYGYLRCRQESRIRGGGHQPRNSRLCRRCPRRWNSCGQKMYPGAQELLVLADAGGSNGVRPRAWKYHLQQQLVNAYGLKVTVCHYPPPPNGLPLNIVCFPRSATIGPADLWGPTKPCSSTFVPRRPNPETPGECSSASPSIQRR